MVAHLTFRQKLYVLYSDFTPGKARARSDGSYWSEVGLISVARRIKYNVGTQCIQGVGMVPGKPEYHNYYL